MREHRPQPSTAPASVATLAAAIPSGVPAIGELAPELRARAERLLRMIPEESSGREEQAVLVTLALARCAA